jgi:3',5'-cyclic-AMP phosphodiesterase
MPIILSSSASTPTRRDFLAGLLAGGVGLVATRSATARASDAPPWYALISDTHIASDPKTKSRGECMADNLRAVVDDILAQSPSPLGALIDGDLALTDGQKGDYQTLLGLVDPLRKGKVPLYLGLGNHDDRAHFRDVLSIEPTQDTEVVDKHVGIVEGPPLRFVVLDSLDRVNVTPGLLGDRQRRWLARALDADRKTPTLLFVHHNLSAEEPNALTDTSALLELLKPRRHVKAVVFGHTHTWTRRDVDGLHLVNLPAVAYPFTNDQPLGWCRLIPDAEGAEIELRCVGGDRKKDRERARLPWRSS